MIYLNNNTSAQTINIPYSQPDKPVTKKVQSQKDFTVTERGQYNISPDSGFTSMEKVHLTVDTPDTQEAFESGQTYQKSLMIGANITENGEYVRPDGYSGVTVVVDQVGPYNSGYTSGYTDGYSSGYTDGVATLPIITGTSYSYQEGDDNTITISAETGTAFSAVTVDASQKFTDGYYIAVDDLESNAVELSVSANGIYNADIQYETRGYIKKVNVNVPSSGGTQEPFFGKVADFTGVGFELNSFSNGQIIEFEFIVPTLSAHTGQTLYIASWEDNDYNVYCNYTSENNKTGLGFENDNTGDEFYIGDITKKVVKIQILKNYNNFLVKSYVDGDIVSYSGDSVNSSHLCLFAMDSLGIIPGEAPRYFKSFKLYNPDYGHSPYKILDIRPRSDGKMWNILTNQESTINWKKYDDTHPTTFNTLYEWDIQ